MSQDKCLECGHRVGVENDPDEHGRCTAMIEGQKKVADDHYVDTVDIFVLCGCVCTFAQPDKLTEPAPLDEPHKKINLVTVLEHQIFRNHDYSETCDECRMTAQIANRLREELGLETRKL